MTKFISRILTAVLCWALTAGLGPIPDSIAAEGNGPAQGCIVTLNTQQAYCLPVGERSGYSLPNSVYDQPVYVNAPPGVGVMLSDSDNLSYNHLAVFVGTVSNADLKHVKARNGEFIDFSHPHSMRVVESNEPLGCIVSLDQKDQYCLPVGQRSGYSLPKYIYDKPVDVKAADGVGVMLSDYDNLSYNRIATFTGNVAHDQLKYAIANNGECLDFSHPHSMRVLKP